MNIHRLNKLNDLTRWNRAGLPTFTYVDGDAAVWLEELRLAAMGLYARNADFDERLPETWRHRFSQDESQWPSAAEQEAFFESLTWQTLARAYPEKPETARQRNRRLLDQYEMDSGEYGWEIMRASARAAHVLLGHLNAYANEGYLRTATQWQNVAKLAAMVNHQPAPAASATTTVGLMVTGTDDDRSVELSRGLAMKYSPPEAPAPIVYETLSNLTVHPDLNVCRAFQWNRDPLPLLNNDTWQALDDIPVSPGMLGVLQAAENPDSVDAVTLASVTQPTNNETVALNLSHLNQSWVRGDVQLHTNAKHVQRALPRTTMNELVIKIDTASNYAIHSPIKLHYNNTSTQLLVNANNNGHLKLKAPSSLTSILDTDDIVSVETLVPVTNSGTGYLAPATVGTRVYYMNEEGTLGDGDGIVKNVFDEENHDTGKALGVSFEGIINAIGALYVIAPNAKRESAIVVHTPNPVLPSSSDYHPERIVHFSGKPPKDLSIGSLFVKSPASGGTPYGLRVDGIQTNEDQYAIQFHIAVTNQMSSFKPDEYLFSGPMTDILRPLNHDRNPTAAFNGAEIILSPISDDARELLRLGKKCLVEDELGLVMPKLATVLEASQQTGGLQLLLEPDEGLVDFKKGWTKINFNAVEASHGETKSPKVLGSGDAEKPLQRFLFKPKDVSFIPSALAEVGVAPDIDVSVDGVIWAYRDLIDPTAAGTNSYSISLNEDGSLLIDFRRRLPTGTNNLVMQRYRTGVGRHGNVPANAFQKPMKKHRYVSAITQPLAATGGAEREPVDDLRNNAPARLAANGRAVSLKDFERLCQRRSDIWQAKAKAITNPAQSENVNLIIVPAEGGVIGDTLRLNLIEFIESRTLPGVRVAIQNYSAIKLMAEVTIRVNVEAYDKTQIQAKAQKGMIETFSLKNRQLGQAVYISEVIAALERVEGVENATVQSFTVTPNDTLLRTAHSGGSPSAYFPFDHQLICAYTASAITDFTVIVEAL